MVESSAPDAKYSPDGDHRTILTGFICRVKSDASSKCGKPSSFSPMYQIYLKRFNSSVKKHIKIILYKKSFGSKEAKWAKKKTLIIKL